MNRSLVILLALALAGCQSAPKSSTSTAADSTAPAAGISAVTADAPKVIAELTDQTTVWECPMCKMDYDRAGDCEMCKVALSEMKVAYVCTADNKPVAKAGKCPDCNAQVRIDKTAVVAAVPPAGGR